MGESQKLQPKVHHIILSSQFPVAPTALVLMLDSMLC